MHTRCDFCSVCGVAWHVTTWLSPHTASTLDRKTVLCFPCEHFLGCWKNWYWISGDVSAWWCTYTLQLGSMPAPECLILCAVDRELRPCSMAHIVTWHQPAWLFLSDLLKSLMYEAAVEQEDIQPWIEVACDKIWNTARIFERVCQSLMRYCQLCTEFEGDSLNSYYNTM
jgi:hypothetical protein